MRSIYRPAALERLSSPEQLDQVMRVTGSRSWLILAAVALLLIATLVWGFYGSIPSKAAGQGLLIKRGGLFEVVSVYSGQVAEVTVKVGDAVKQGQTVALISQPELDDQITQATAQLNDLENQHQIITVQGATQLTLELKALAREKANTEQTMATRRKWIESLRNRVAKEESLLKKGMIGSETLLEAQDRLNRALSDQKDDENKMAALEAQVEEKKQTQAQDVAQSRQSLDDAREKLTGLKDSKRLQSKVVCQQAGKVLEIKLDSGQMIKRGQALLEMEGLDAETAKLTAIGFFPPGDGKTITVGMKAQVLPETVKAEEYGFMEGRVKTASEFPATEQGMMRLLNNEELVKSLSRSGPPIQVEIELKADDKTPTGYAWSSAQGPPVKVTSGTVCQVTVITREQTPASLALPMFRKYVLGVGSGPAG